MASSALPIRKSPWLTCVTICDPIVTMIWQIKGADLGSMADINGGQQLLTCCMRASSLAGRPQTASALLSLSVKSLTACSAQLAHLLTNGASAGADGPRSAMRAAMQTQTPMFGFSQVRAALSSA